MSVFRPANGRCLLGDAAGHARSAAAQGLRCIAEVVAQWTGIPVSQMMETESEKLLHMEERLHRRLVGQERAVAALSDAIRRSRSGLSDPRRPIGSFIFLGSSGVGKTELAKALAWFLFASTMQKPLYLGTRLLRIGPQDPAGAQVLTTLLLGKECGVQVDDDTLLGSLRYFYRFAGRGTVPYGDHRGEGRPANHNRGDNGGHQHKGGQKALGQRASRSRTRHIKLVDGGRHGLRH